MPFPGGRSGAGPALPGRPPGGRPLLPRDTALRNAWVVLLPELLWGFASALTIEGPMPAAFARSLGGGERFLGAWALIGAAVAGLGMLFTGWFAASLATKRAFVFWGHVATGALYLPVALLPRWAQPLGPDVARAAALLGFGLYVFSLGLLMPAWLALVGALFPEGQRSRVLGLVFVVNRIGGIAGGWAAGRLLALPWHDHDVWTLLWGLAALTATLGGLPFLAALETPLPTEPRRPLRRHLAGLVESLRHTPGLGRFLSADLLALAGFVTLAFYGHVALRERGLPESRAGAWIAWAAGAQLAGAGAVAWAGSRLLPRRGLACGALAAAAAALLVPAAHTASAFDVVAVLGGLHLVSRQTCFGPQVLRLARGHEPTRPLGATMAVASLAQGCLPWIAGWLAPVTGFPALFFAVGGLSLLAAALLLLFVGDGPGADVS